MRPLTAHASCATRRPAGATPSLRTGVLFALCLTGAAAQAAVVTAVNGRAAVTEGPLSAEWVVTTPTAADTISWTSGHNTTDEGVHGKRSLGPEPKFSFTPPFVTGLTYKGRTFTGMPAITDTGVCGSTAKTSGSGSSSVQFVGAGVGAINVGVALWRVSATGTLGTPCRDAGAVGPRGARVLRAEWSARATGEDPMALLPADFAGVTGPTATVFFVAALLDGDYSERGGIGLSVAWETAAGTESLLDIDLSGMDGVRITTGSLTGLDIYRMTGFEQGTDVIDPSNLLTAADMRSLLEADVLGDRTLDTPLYLGFRLSWVPVPTADLGDGSVARVHVDSDAFDANEAFAVVPEPGSSGLLAGGGLLLFARRLRDLAVRRHRRTGIPIDPSGVVHRSESDRAEPASWCVRHHTGAHGSRLHGSGGTV